MPLPPTSGRPGGAQPPGASDPLRANPKWPFWPQLLTDRSDVPTSFPTGQSIQLVRRPPWAYIAKPEFRGPVFAPAAAAFVPSPISVALAAQRQRVARSTWEGPPPASFIPLTPPPRIRLAPWDRTRQRTGLELPPRQAVVTPAATFTPEPTRITTAPTVRVRPTRCSLRPPIVVNTTAAFTPAAPQTHLARWDRTRPRTGFAQLRAPAIISPATSGPLILPIPVRVKLVPPPPRLRGATHTLRPPTVVGAAQAGSFPPAGVLIQLVRPPLRRQHGARSKLRPPTVVNPFVAPIVTVQAGTDWAPVMATW